MQKKKNTIKNKMPAGVFMSGTGCKRAGGTCESVIDSVHMSQRRVDMDGCVDMVNQAVCRREGRREGGASTAWGNPFRLSPKRFCFVFPHQKNDGGNFTFERRLKFIQPANAPCHYLRAANCLGNARR